MSRDPRFNFDSIRVIDSEHIIAGRGKRMSEAQINAFLNDHEGEWVILKDLLQVLGSDESELQRICQEMNTTVRFSTEDTDYHRCVKITRD